MTAAWQMTPVEPTQEMVRAAYVDQPGAINVGFAQAYRKMLEHVPPVPEPTPPMIDAAAKELWNDLYGRVGGTWESRDPREVIVVQLKATAKAILQAALKALATDQGKPWAVRVGTDYPKDQCFEVLCPNGEWRGCVAVSSLDALITIRRAYAEENSR